MTAVPSVRTWTDGEIPPVDTMNAALYDTWKFLLNPPMVKARQITAQNFTSGGWYAVTFTSEEVDTHGFHSTTTNNARFTPTVPGYYVGYFGISFAYNGSGRRVVGIRKNGSDIRWRTDIKAPLNAANSQVIKGVAFGPIYMNGTTDYLEAMAYQNSGSTLATDVPADTDYEKAPEFYMRWWSA